MKKSDTSMEKWVNYINKAAGRIGLVVLFGMMLLTFADVIGRYFSRPIPGTFELTELALPIIVFFAIGYTYTCKGHVSIDFLVPYLPKRVKAIIDSFNNIVAVVVFALVSWQLFVHAQRLFEGNNISGVLHLPLYPVAVLAAIGSLLFSVAVLVDLKKSLSKVVSRNGS